MASPSIAAVLVVLSALQAGSQATGSRATPPRGGPITIDGRVQDDEWRNALRVEHPAGTVVRLLRDADNVYLGITSTRKGFASLCLSQRNEVHVLHASAALGAVTYRPRGDTWNSADTAFSYGMRNTALTDAAHTERAAFLAQRGWVASTIRMGADEKTQEMQISLRKFPLPFSIALGRWLITENSSETWPATTTDHEGCFAQRLVQGYVPQGITFKPAYWLSIEPEAR